MVRSDAVELPALLARLARADLAADVAAEIEPDEVVERSLRRLVTLVPGAQEAVVAISDAGRLASTRISTGPLAETLFRLEEACGTGPAHDAALGYPLVRVDDLTHDPRWPDLAEHTACLGAVSLLAAELPTAHGPHGALMIAAHRRAAFPVGAAQIALNVANRLAIAIAYANKLADMHRAINSRQIIGQACGILMERHKLTAPQAFERLATASQRNHLKLSTVAEGVVETGQEPDEVRG